MLSQLAENFVRALFEKKNIKILAQNFRGVGFELDLIVQDNDDTLIAVEVKFRKNLTRHLDQLIPPKKLRSLKRGLEYFEFKNFTFVKNKRIDLAIVGSNQKGFFLFKYITGH